MIYFIEPRAKNSLLNMQTYKRQDLILFIYLFIFIQADLSEILDPSNEMEKSKNSQSLICGRPLLWKTVCASVHAKSLSAD